MTRTASGLLSTSTARRPARTAALAGCAAAGEEVEHPVARIGMYLHDPVQDGYRLLRRVAGLLPAVRAHDRLPPHIGRRLAARRLHRPDKARRHVGNAVYVVIAVGVVFGVARIPEDVVMLGGPAPLGPRAVIVGPDDLVYEALAPEDFVQQHLAVMRFAVVDMEEEGARGCEQPVRLPEPGLDEGHVVVERIVPGGGAEADRPVALALEARPVALVVLDRPKPCASLCFAGIERRVDIDEVEAAILQAGEHLQIVAQVDFELGRCAGRVHSPARASRPGSAPVASPSSNVTSPAQTVAR